ncbi:MAG: hypothetical protein H6727_11995 [Myxococcales bacterium]|nr:hypothetical protein [Myxococcales bacterium]
MKKHRWIQATCLLGIVVATWLWGFGSTQKAWAGRCNRNLCYKWDARKKRCVFRCRPGKDMCFRGRCVQIKRCRWALCERFNPAKRRCESRCRGSLLCHKGRCMKQCPRTHCYNTKTKRCVQRCPSGTRCLRGKCRR